MPRPAGFRRWRFEDGADAPLADRFAPPAGVLAAPDGGTASFSTSPAAFAGSEGGSAALALEAAFVGSEGGSATLALEDSFAGSGLELTPAAGFMLPTASGTLRNDKGITIRNIDH